MAKRSKKKKTTSSAETSPANSDKGVHSRSLDAASPWTFGAPLVLATLVFFIYWPSLKSGFVFDGKYEILKEGFITSFSNLPDVLSLKVLSTNLLLGDRPGQLLYLMLQAAIWDKDPWGYHLASNLLHASNAALLFILISRLCADQLAGLPKSDGTKARVATGAACLIFALHPFTVETVSAINYSSDLLVTFFTLLALLTATAFRSNHFRQSMSMGSAIVFFAFMAVTCKESGIAATFALIAYWFLYRRGEPKGPWILLFGATLATTSAFLTARFLLALPNPLAPHYLGGSFFHALAIQPRLWVFMLGKLLWPTQLSADYTLGDASGVVAPFALVMLFGVVFFQGWLSNRNRVGALGVAIFWLGLATVSNLIPLNRINADRFYYLPMVGVALQLVALFFMTLRIHSRKWANTALTLLILTIFPLALLTLKRQPVFANEMSLWRDTIQASPSSWTAYDDLGAALLDEGDVEDAKTEIQKALALNPNDDQTHNNYGMVLLDEGQPDAAMTEIEKALAINPSYGDGYYNLGNVLLQKKDFSQAIGEYQKALELKPNLAEAHCNLGLALFDEGKTDDAIAQYVIALEIDPGFAFAYNNLGIAYKRKGDLDRAIAYYRKALEINAGYTDAQANLSRALAKKAALPPSTTQLQSLMQGIVNEKTGVIAPQTSGSK